MTNNAKVGGVLNIVAGGLGILGMLIFILMAVFMAAMPGFMGPQYYNGDTEAQQVFTIMAVVYGVMGIVGILVGVVAIVGGAYALKKRCWGWALAGAICGALVFFPCGIPAIIFIALSRSEFPSDAPPPEQAGPPQAIVG